MQYVLARAGLKVRLYLHVVPHTLIQYHDAL